MALARTSTAAEPNPRGHLARIGTAAKPDRRAGAVSLTSGRLRQDSLPVVAPRVPVVEVLHVLSEQVDVLVGGVLGPHEPVAVYVSLGVGRVLRRTHTADVLQQRTAKEQCSRRVNGPMRVTRHRFTSFLSCECRACLESTTKNAARNKKMQLAEKRGLEMYQKKAPGIAMTLFRDTVYLLSMVS